MNKPKKSTTGPSLSPQNVSPTVWYYEDRGSLDFVVECGGKTPVRFRVPVSMLAKSLSRIRGKS